jgi:hypothetical protein
MNISEKYVDFILNNHIPFKSFVEIPEPQLSGGSIMWQFGKKNVTIETNVTILARYTRSAKLLIKFDKYEVEKIFFISIDESPNHIFFKYEKMLSNLIYNRYFEDGRIEEIIALYKIEQDKIKDIIVNHIKIKK